MDMKKVLLTAELYEAARVGNVAHALQLIKQGADINGIAENESPLAVAAAHGHLACMALLITSGADVEREDGLGVRPLQRAAAAGQVTAVEVLLGANAVELDHLDSINGTALHSACKRGHSEVAELLLQCGASVDVRNNGGATPLLLAAELGHKDCIRTLLEHGADPHAATPTGRTPFVAASGSWIGEEAKRAVFALLERPYQAVLV